VTAVAPGGAGANLLVRVSSASGPDVVTVPAPNDLRFSGVWSPGGGWKACSCTLQLPWGITPAALAPWSHVAVIDRRSGRTVWYGRLTDPGLTPSTSGTGYALAAEGGQTHADGWKTSYILVDRDPDHWGAVGDYPGSQQSNEQGAFSVHPSDYMGVASGWALTESIAAGTGANGGITSSWQYIDGNFERIIGSALVNITEPSMTFEVLLATATSGGYQEMVTQQFVSGSQWNFDVYRGVGLWPSGDPVAAGGYLRIGHTSGTLTFTSAVKSYIGNVVVIHPRYRWDGSDAGAWASPALTTAGLVEDLVGRGFSGYVEYDPGRLAATATDLVPSASWLEGVSAREVLDYATQWSPHLWWEVGAPGPTRRPVLALGSWNDPPRYVIAPGQGKVELSGGAGSIANECIVYYQSGTFGKSVIKRTTRVGVNVQFLSDAGITRSMQIDITGDGIMSGDDANARGFAALAQSALGRTTGKVTITGPIFDRTVGRMVEPWELRGGCTAVIPDARTSYSRSTSLATATADDSAAVFRVTGTDYDASTNSCALTLDGGALSLIGRVRDETTPRRYEVGNVRR
jgi:hypothetical protein